MMPKTVNNGLLFRVREIAMIMAMGSLIHGCSTVADKSLVRSENIDELRNALAEGMNPDMPTKIGEPLLVVAARNNASLETIQVLLAHGADSNAAEENGMPALYYAMFYQNQEVIKALRRYGAEYYNIPSTARYNLVCRGLSQKLEGYDDPEFLRSMSISPNHRCAYRPESPVYIAAKHGFGLDALREIGGDINEPIWPGGHTPLVHAIYNDPDAIQNMLEAGADVTMPSKGNTPAWHTEKSGRASLPSMLLVQAKRGGEVSEQQWRNAACNIIALGMEKDSLLEILHTSSLPENFLCNDDYAIFEAIRSDSPGALTVLLEYGANPAMASRTTGKSPLQVAVSEQNHGAMEVLMNRGLESELTYKDVIQAWVQGYLKITSATLSYTPAAERLKIVCTLIKRNNDAEMIREIHEAGVNLDGKCSEDRRLIAVAVMENSGGTIKLLHKLGADLEIADAFREMTPLQLALRKNRQMAVRALLEEGVSAEHLTHDEVKTASYDKDLLGLLAANGLPDEVMRNIRKVEKARAAKRECHERAQVTGKHPLYHPILTALWKPLQKHKNENIMRAALLDVYRECLERAKRIAYSESGYPYQQISNETPPRLTSAFLAPAQVEMVRSLSYLAPRSLSNQDPERAQELMRKSFDELQTAASKYRAGIGRYITAQREKLQQEREEAERKAWLGLGISVLGAVALEEAGVSNQEAWEFAQQGIELSMDEFNKEMEQINSVEISAPDGVSVEKWQNDGVRLFVPRFRSSDSSGALSASMSYDHTGRIVRLHTRLPGGSWGNCSGAVVGDGTILTAQHCIMNDSDQWPMGIRAAYEYMSVNSKGDMATISRDALLFDGPWHVETSAGEYRKRKKNVGKWRNDWALLHAQIPEDELPRWLRYGMTPLFSQGFARFVDSMEGNGEKEEWRISLAGYTSHLNQGRYLTMDWGCRGIGVDRGILKHLCKGWRGDSGAPVVIANGPYKSRIVGVHSFSIGRSSSEEVRMAGEDVSLRGAVTTREIRRQFDRDYVRDKRISTLSQ